MSTARHQGICAPWRQMDEDDKTRKAKDKATLRTGVGAGSLVVLFILLSAVQGCDKGKSAVEELNARLPNGCTAPVPDSKGLLEITCTLSGEASERGEVERNIGKLEETIEKVEKALKPGCSALREAGFANIHVGMKLSYQSDEFASAWAGNTERCLLGGHHENCSDGFSVDGDMCKRLDGT